MCSNAIISTGPARNICAVELKGAYKPYIIYGRTFRCEVVVLWNMLEKFVWYVGSTLTLSTRNIFARIVYLSSLILLASDVAGRNTWVALGILSVRNIYWSIWLIILEDLSLVACSAVFPTFRMNVKTLSSGSSSPRLWQLYPEDNALRSFETSVTTRSKTQRHMPLDLKPQPHRCDNLSCQFCY